MSQYDELIRGAIDLHCHIDIEFSLAHRKAEPESSWLPRAEAMGMRGFVLKSHWWPTANVVPYIRESYKGPVELWSSVTLNPICGGPTTEAIEACVALGGRVAFLPTWSAQHDIEHGGFSTRIKDYYPSFSLGDFKGYVFLDARRELTDGAKELVDCCKRLNVALGTGHVSWEESLAFATFAHDIGFKNLLINHPLNRRTNAPLDGLQKVAELGAFIEICWTQVAPGRTPAQKMVAAVREIGPSQIVASTDYFRPGIPNPPELMCEYLGMLSDAGLSKVEIRQIAAENPARALSV